MSFQELCGYLNLCDCNIISNTIPIQQTCSNIIPYDEKKHMAPIKHKSNQEKKYSLPNRT